MHLRARQTEAWLEGETGALESVSSQTLIVLVGHEYGVNDVAILPDGKRAVSAYWDGPLRVWGLDSGRLLARLEGHTCWVNHVAVLPDGKCALSESGDRMLRVWDPDGGACLTTFHAGQFISSLAVVNNNQYVFAPNSGPIRRIRFHPPRLIEP
jgi:WD40 repeat protein